MTNLQARTYVKPDEFNRILEADDAGECRGELLNRGWVLRLNGADALLLNAFGQDFTVPALTARKIVGRLGLERIGEKDDKQFFAAPTWASAYHTDRRLLDGVMNGRCLPAPDSDATASASGDGMSGGYGPMDDDDPILDVKPQAEPQEAPDPEAAPAPDALPRVTMEEAMERLGLTKGTLGSYVAPSTGPVLQSEGRGKDRRVIVDAEFLRREAMHDDAPAFDEPEQATAEEMAALPDAPVEEAPPEALTPEPTPRAAEPDPTGDPIARAVAALRDERTKADAELDAARCRMREMQKRLERIDAAIETLSELIAA